MNRNKENKIINYLREELNRPENDSPQRQAIILETVFSHLILQKHKIEEDKEFDGNNAVEFHYEELSARINNQNDFIDLSFDIRDIRDNIKQKETKAKKNRNRFSIRTKEEKEFDTMIEQTNKKLNTLLTKTANCLGLDKNALETNLRDKTREDMKVYSIDARKEEEAIMLIWAYKNRARQNLNELDIVFGGQFELSYEFIERIEGLRDIEKIVDTFTEGIWKSIYDTLLMLEIDVYEQVKENKTLYKYLKLLPRNIRESLYFIEKNVEKITIWDKDDKTKTKTIEIRNEQWDKYREFIDETLTYEQIQELFYDAIRWEKNSGKSKQTLITELTKKEKELEETTQLLNETNNEIIPKIKTDYEAIIHYLKISYEREIQGYQNSILEETNVIIEKTRQIKIIHRELLKWRDYALRLERTNKIINRKLSESQVNNTELNNWIDALTNDIESLEEDRRNLESDNKLIFNQNQELLILYNSAEDKIRGLLSFLKDYRQKIKNLQAEKNTLNELVDGTNSEITDTKKDIIHLQQTLIENNKFLIQEQDNHSSTYSYLNTAKQELDALTERLKKLEEIANIYYTLSEQEKEDLRRQVISEQKYTMELLATVEKWNKGKFDKLEEQRQNLIEIIREKNDKLDKLEDELYLSNFEKASKETENSNSEIPKPTDTDYRGSIKLELEDDFSESDLWKIKDSLEDQEEETNRWIKKYWTERKRFINHDIYLVRETKRAEKFKKKYKQSQQEIRDLWQEIRELKDQHDKTKNQRDKVKTRLGEQVNNLHNLEKSKDEAVRKMKIELGKANRVIEDKEDQIEDLNWKLEVRTTQRDRARQKLRVIKHNKKKLKEKAKNEGVCMTLIKWEDISQRYLENNDNSLVKALDDTQHGLVDTIIDTQNYLGVGNLTEIETTHEMPTGKTLKDLIEFYNNPPTATPTNTYVEVPKEIPVESPKVIVKPVEKIKLIDTPFGEDLEVIKNIDLNSLEQELEIHLSKEVRQKISKATTYQELVSIREEELKKFLNQQNKGDTYSTQITQSPKQGIEKWWWVLVFLLIIKALVIGGLAIKILKKPKKLGKS